MLCLVPNLYNFSLRDNKVFLHLYLCICGLLQGYMPSVFYPKLNNKQLFQNLRLQCEQMDMPFLSFFPSEAHLIADSYNLVVDAIFGHNYKGPASPEFAIILDKLKQIQNDIPICSIDIPSG